MGKYDGVTTARDTQHNKLQMDALAEALDLDARMLCMSAANSEDPTDCEADKKEKPKKSLADQLTPEQVAKGKAAIIMPKPKVTPKPEVKVRETSQVESRPSSTYHGKAQNYVPYRAKQQPYTRQTSKPPVRQQDLNLKKQKPKKQRSVDNTLTILMTATLVCQALTLGLVAGLYALIR